MLTTPSHQCRFDLGDIAPQANGIKVYHQEADDKDQVLMDLDFSWVGEQDVQLQIKPLPKHLGPLSPAGALLSSIVRLRVGLENPLPSSVLATHPHNFRASCPLYF